MSADDAATRRAFRAAVNMTPGALKTWLATDDSQSVGMVPGAGLKSDGAAGEAVGHHMGARIVAMLRRKVSELQAADYDDMRKVVGYVKRHSAQRPAGDVSGTKWRKSLMNWGHDPLK